MNQQERKEYAAQIDELSKKLKDTIDGYDPGIVMINLIELMAISGHLFNMDKTEFVGRVVTQVSQAYDLVRFDDEAKEELH